MNQKIKELAERAGFCMWKEEKWNPGDVIDWSCRYDDELEKFFDLIVRECVQTLIDNTPARYTNEAAEEDWDKGYDRAMTDCVHHIKEHFGVEE